MYKLVNSLKRDFKQKERFHKNDDGKLISSEKEIAENGETILTNC